MKHIGLIYAVATFGTLALALLVPHFAHRRGSAGVPGWQFMVQPGELSPSHRFLAMDCEACHTPHRGVTAEKCIACHADDRDLLQRQPTAFHATIGRCRDCHIEHTDSPRDLVHMDHRALSRATQRIASDSTSTSVPTRTWRSAPRSFDAVDDAIALRLHPDEQPLLCVSCHANQDRHRSLFGRECGACHSTDTWTISEFRHPSPASKDCAECHQAPPSHYMEHFHMVSMRVARQEHAKVEQCSLCHQTNSWNDIRDVGWYKHH